MTSAALVVLSLALVCSTYVTATEQPADHDIKHTMRIYTNNYIANNKVGNINTKMETSRTNTDSSIEKSYLSNNKLARDSKRERYDEIYNEFRNVRAVLDNRMYTNKTRWYNVIDDAKRRVKRDTDGCDTFRFDPNDMKISHPYNKSSNDGHYLRSMECVVVIKASIGQIITLTFVDTFHIESHPLCKYDYLDIRDGKHGFAKLHSRLCGKAFPPQITSTGPYLWLKFHSDESIEYEGFHINVNFSNAPSHNIPDGCNKTFTEDYGVIDSKEIDPECITGSAEQALDAVWTVMTRENTKIYLNFTAYALALPNECEQNVVQVYGEKLEEDKNLAHYCGSLANSVMTPSNIMYVRVYATKSARNFTFNATYSAFRTLDPSKGEKCGGEEFDCEDNTCIAGKLKCDGNAHCRMKTDESPDNCNSETESMLNQPDILAILVIFSLILFGMSFAFLFKCFRKLYQDHKLIKEHIKQSCEDRLDTLMDDSRFTLDAKKLQRDSEPRASLERENHTNEMYKKQRKLSQQRKPSSIDSDFIQETHLDLEEEPWRRAVDSKPIEAQDIKIERNGRSRKSDTSKREETLRRERSKKLSESEEHKETKEIRDASVGAPDTKESGCQTRESLFQTETAPSSDGSGSNSRGFSTFGYSGGTIAKPSPPATTNTSQVTIELLRQVPVHQESKSQKKIPDRRPMSTETTRSAPDVIIVSKPIR